MSFDHTLLPQHRRDPGVDGYVYVIKFTTGTVKVGRTASPRDRFDSHANDAAKFGAQISDAWLSPRHRSFSSNERLLIEHVAADSSPYRAEYFPDADFARAVAFVQTLKFDAITDDERRALTPVRPKLFGEYSWQAQGQVLVAVADRAIAPIAQTLLGGPDYWATTPSLTSSDEDTANLVSSIATATGCTLEEVQAWTPIQVFERLLTTHIRTAGVRLAAWAAENDRHDLLVPAFDHAVAAS